MISFAGGLGANDGVLGSAEKGHLLHNATLDEHNFTQCCLLQRGLVLQVQLHGVWDFTPDTQPGLFFCLRANKDNTSVCQVDAVRSVTFSLFPVPVGAGADQTWWDGYGGWNGDVGVWSAAESELSVGQSATNSQTPLLRFCWPRDRQHESPPDQHTGVMWLKWSLALLYCLQ